MNLFFEAYLTCKTCGCYINKAKKPKNDKCEILPCQNCIRDDYEMMESDLEERYEDQVRINKLIENKNSFLSETKKVFAKFYPEGNFDTWLQQPYWNNKKLTILKAFEEGEGQKIIDTLQCLMIGNVGA